MHFDGRRRRGGAPRPYTTLRGAWQRAAFYAPASQLDVSLIAYRI
jgi:hypothetical protein